jgi:NAD(P)-dependent dehydrogenase (short-subunit alcohol dehydrogenase family)
MELQGKIVLVTGASSGIGKAIAIAFAQKRAQVFVHYGKNKVGGQETLREVEKFSSGRLCQADLMDPGATKSLRFLACLTVDALFRLHSLFVRPFHSG